MHPFGTIKARMGATHFLMKTLPRVRTEMALHVLVLQPHAPDHILGTGPLMAANAGFRLVPLAWPLLSRRYCLGSPFRDPEIAPHRPDTGKDRQTADQM